MAMFKSNVYMSNLGKWANRYWTTRTSYFFMRLINHTSDYYSGILRIYTNTTMSTGRHVASLGHILYWPGSQSVFTFTPWFCIFCGEAAKTNCINFGLTQPGLDPMIYDTRGEHANHYGWNQLRKITLWCSYQPWHHHSKIGTFLNSHVTLILCEANV